MEWNLNGLIEKIDIINWTEQPEILITRSLSPARPIDLYIDEDRLYAVAVFEDEDLAIAIGRNGQNIKLVSRITGFTVDAVSKSDYNNPDNSEGATSPFDDLPDKVKSLLIENGIDSFSSILESKEKILEIKGLGPKTFEKIYSIAEKNVNE